jgi:hypothetical protein
MHKGHYSDSYYVLARCLGRFAKSIATISLIFRVSAKVIIDPRIKHPIDPPVGHNPNTFVYTLRASHPRRGVPIRHASKKLLSSPEYECIGARRPLVASSSRSRENDVTEITHREVRARSAPDARGPYLNCTRRRWPGQMDGRWQKTPHWAARGTHAPQPIN